MANELNKTGSIICEMKLKFLENFPRLISYVISDFCKQIIKISLSRCGDPVKTVWTWWLNSSWLSDAICRHRSGSTLAHVMACFLMAPSHYLNQCWPTISKVQWHSSEGNSTRDTLTISHWNFPWKFLLQISQGSMSCVLYKQGCPVDVAAQWMQGWF